MFENAIDLVTSFVALWPLWVPTGLLGAAGAVACKSGRASFEITSKDYEADEDGRQVKGKKVAVVDGEIVVRSIKEERQLSA